MDKTDFQAASQIRGEDAEDTKLLREMAREARNYVSSFEWCPPIEGLQLAYGIGRIVAIFLFDFERAVGGTDKSLWVVVGDLPSAYLVTIRGDSPKLALERYCDLMDDWAGAVLSDRDLRDVFPVAAEPTTTQAVALSDRMDFMRTIILPQVEASKRLQ